MQSLQYEAVRHKATCVVLWKLAVAYLLLVRCHFVPVTVTFGGIYAVVLCHLTSDYDYVLPGLLCEELVSGLVTVSHGRLN
jgi:hypothetical protein